MIADARDPALPSITGSLLSAGGIAVLPCDTIYGLVGRAPDTEKRLRDAKGRGETNPFLQLIPDPDWVSRFSDVPVPPALERYWPGPLTLVFPLRGGGTAALRVPDSTFLRELVRTLGSPLYSTSVNTAGSPALWRISDIIREFESKVDLVVDGGDLPTGVPSTIVDAASRPLRILRQGALRIPPEAL
jgi:L-threonylcarbamoyladenylate synthase